MQSSTCKQCKLVPRFCYCRDLLSIDNKNWVTFIAHNREDFLSSNTAKLADRTLSKSNIFFRGGMRERLTAEEVIKPELKPLFLFPDKDSVDIREFSGVGDTQIIVPDGTWKQAKKIKRRENFLEDVTSVHIPFQRKSNFQLRHQYRPEHLCTLEAVAYCLGALGEREVEETLLLNLRTLVEAHLSCKGYWCRLKG